MSKFVAFAICEKIKDLIYIKSGVDTNQLEIYESYEKAINNCTHKNWHVLEVYIKKVVIDE